MVTRRLALAGLAGVLSGSRRLHAQALPTISVVASFSVLADFVRVVGGDRIEAAALVGPDTDVHGYEPTPGDARTLAASKLIVENGLGLETWIDQLIGTAAAQAPILVASRGVKVRSRDERGAALDPHAWMAVPNAKLYVANIRDALRRVDAGDAKLINAGAATYLAKLDALEAEIRAAVETIPAARRVLVTGHDAFGYFAAAYGLRSFTPPALTQRGSLGPREIATAAKQVKAQGAPALFGDAVSDPALLRQLAAESGVPLAGTLYADALTPASGPASTYLAMMRYDVRTILGALRP